MKLRRLLCVLLASVGVMGSLTIAVEAAKGSDENAVWLEDLPWIWIDPAEVEPWESGPMPMATYSVDATLSAHSFKTIGQAISLTVNDVVAFDCSYSPSSASMDFGVIAPNGKFYFINVEEGSFSQVIRVNQTGSYSVAIRNNSSQAVRVVGFVNC